MKSPVINVVFKFYDEHRNLIKEEATSQNFSSNFFEADITRNLALTTFRIAVSSGKLVIPPNAKFWKFEEFFELDSIEDTVDFITDYNLV